MCEHHLLSNGKANPGPVPFGGLEQSKDVEPFWNSGTGILDGDANLLGIENGRGDDDVAIFVDGLDRVLHQIVEDAPQLVLIGTERRQVFGESDLDLDAPRFRQRSP